MSYAWLSQQGALHVTFVRERGILGSPVVPETSRMVRTGEFSPFVIIMSSQLRDLVVLSVNCIFGKG